jgi:hypothetical protein
MIDHAACTPPSKYLAAPLKWSSMATIDPIEEALTNLVLQESPNYKRTAKKYRVIRTALSRRHRGLYRSIHKAREFQRLLSTEQEAALINHINKLFKAEIPLTSLIIRVFTFKIS